MCIRDRDSRYLTEDMAEMLPELVDAAAAACFPDVGAVLLSAGQVINNRKVTDHHAIIPTKELQKCTL